MSRDSHRSTTTIELTCVVCPKGCRLIVHCSAQTGEVRSVEQAACKKGSAWAIQEISDPVRTLCSSVLVLKGKEPLTGVKTSSPVPLRVFEELMELIRATAVTAPIHSGETVISHPNGLECSIIATRSVDAE